MSNSSIKGAISLALLSLLVLAAAVPAHAEPRRLTVSGHGEVGVRPDVAILSVGASTRAATAGQALEAANAVVRALFARARALGIADSDLATQQIGVGPVYANRRNNEELPVPIAFQASNQVEITIRELDKAGAVIDAMAEAGANTIGGLQFTVSEPGPHEDRARRLAVQDAKRRALLFAEEAGVTLGPILSIDEGGGGPVFPKARMLAMEARTPVAPGENAIAASVTIVFGLTE